MLSLGNRQLRQGHEGDYRVHEFMKVEQVISRKNDLQESEKMVSGNAPIAREILEELKLPYRVIDAATGDIGPKNTG